MHDKAFFDSNTLLYMLSPDRAKAAVVEALLKQRGVISVQVLNEIVNVTRRKSKMEWKAVQSFLREVQLWCNPVVPLTLATHRDALHLAQKYRYSIYDSLILASATEHGCSVIYSEDMQDGQRIGSLTICNPFRKPQ